MTTFTSQRDRDLLLVRGMRELLDDYATNRYGGPTDPTSTG